MKDLQSILKAVARGKMEVSKAETLIQGLFEGSYESAARAPVDEQKVSHSRGTAAAKSSNAAKQNQPKQKIDSALAQLGERVGFAALMKKSKTLGSRVEFGVEHKGFEARLSVFAGVSVSSDSQTEANIISGSQWKDVSFEDMAEVRRNHFTITQVTDLTCSRSNFSANEMGLARLSNVSIAESRFENNRLSRSQCIDVSMAESDFTHNRLLRSELRGVVLNASRIANLVMSGSKWSECDFDQSDLQGLKFEGCTFTECRFVNCEIV